MVTVQMPPQTAQMNSTEALWTLIQSQSRSVQRTLTKRLMDLDLQARLNAARKEIREGKCVTLRSAEDIDNYFDSL